MAKRISLWFFVAFFITVIQNADAVTAVPWPIEKQQPDGTKISVYLRGNEKVHWFESLDGYTLMYDTNKYLVYAEKNSDGSLVPSKVKFGKDKPSASIVKGLRYSNKQLSILRQIWAVTDDIQIQRAFVGEKKGLVLLADYSDKSMTKTQAEFEALMNQIGYSTGGAKGSVRDFFLENSYGLMDFTVTVAGIYHAPNTMAYYGESSGSHYREFANFVVNAADNDVDYSQFAVNGVVESIHIIFAGYGDEYFGTGQNIWSHAWTLGGTVVKDGVQLSRYSCSPELNGSSGSTLTRIGVLCHELTHVFGAPDYYETDYSSGYAGTGAWDLMAEGPYNGGSAQPAHINPYEKIRLGWITPQTLTPGQTVSAMPNSAFNPVVYIVQANSNGEQYILENKQQTGFDTSLPGHGLLIWHAIGNMPTNSPNVGHPQGLYPVCASSTYPIPTGTVASYGNINSAGCPYPGTSGNTEFTDNSTPMSFSWVTNAGIGKPITNIAENTADKTVSFGYIAGIVCDPVTNLQGSEAGGTVSLSWDKPANDEVIGYKIYRDGNLVYTSNNPQSTQFQHINVLNGTYTYSVTAKYPATESTEESVTVTVSGNSSTFGFPVTNLTATASTSSIHLAWDSPFQGGYISIAGDYSTAYGLGDEWESFQGSLWNPSDLAGMDEYQITKVKFIPREIATGVTYAVEIYEVPATGDPVLKYSQAITPGVSNGNTAYKEYTLTTPYTIDATKGLVIGTRIHTKGGYYLTVDAGGNYPGRNLFFDVEGWYTFEDLGIGTGENYCFAAYLSNGSGSPVILNPNTNSANFNDSFLSKAKKTKSLKQFAKTKSIPQIIDRAPALVQKYEIYRDGVKIDEVTATQYDDVGLAQNTTYSYSVVVIYDTGAKSEAVSIEATTENPYKPVTNLKASTGLGYAYLTWKKPENAEPSSYKVFRDGVEIAEVTENSYLDNGLTLATDYEYCVTAEYSENIYSTPTTFFSQDFEGSLTGWLVVDKDGDGKNWGIGSSASYAHGGSRMAISYSYQNTALTPDNWLISPALTLTADNQYILKWYAAAYSNAYPADNYGVYISNSYPGTTDVSSFTPLFVETMTAAPSANRTLSKNVPEFTDSPDYARGNYYERTVDLSAYAGQTVYIAFRHFDCSDEWAILIDDISISEAEIIGTNHLGSSDEVCVEKSTVNPYKPVDNVSPQVVAYDVTLNWTVEPIVTSGDDDNRVVIFEEGFDEGSYAALPTGWTSVDADGDGNNWYQLNYSDNPSLVPHGGEGFATSASYNGSILYPDNWLISPPITLTADNNLDYWVGAQDASWAAEYYGVFISTTDANPTSFTSLFEETVTPIPGAKISGKVQAGTFRSSDAPEYVQGAWRQRTIDLSAYAGQTVYIAFRHFNCSDWFRLNIDDVRLTAPIATTLPVDDYSVYVPTFNVYRDGTQIASALTEKTFTEEGLAAGTYNYCIEAVYDDGNGGSVVTVPKCKTVTIIDLGDPHLPVTSLNAATTEHNGVISWNAPQFASRLRYNDFESGSFNMIGTGSTADFDIAIRFTPEQLKDYDGLMLTKVRFIPVLDYETTQYSIRIWQGGDWDNRDAGTLIVDQPVSTVATEVYQEVNLDAPLLIDPTQELWIGLRCNTSTGYPAAMQMPGAIEEFGNLMFFQGNWYTATELASSLNGNWIIDATVAYHQGLTATKANIRPIIDAENRYSEGDISLAPKTGHFDAPQNVAPALPSVVKYLITRDGAYLDETSATSYSDNVPASGTYTYGVTAIYDDGIASAERTIDVNYISECDNAPQNVVAIREANTAKVTWNYTHVVLPGEDPFDILLDENFNSGLPLTWTTIDADGDGEGWYYEGDGAGDGFVSSDSWSFQTFTAVNPDNWLITPQISVKDGTLLSYTYFDMSDYGYSENYGIFVSTTDKNPSSFTKVFEETGMYAPAALKAPRNYSSADKPQRNFTGAVTRTIDLSAYAGQQVYVAFRHYNCYDQYWMTIDDVKITAPKGEKPSKFRIYTEKDGVQFGSVAEVDNVKEYDAALTESGNYRFGVSYVGTVDCESEITWSNPVEFKTITFTATVADKVYDGTRIATVTSITFQGLDAGDELIEGTDYSVESALFSDKNVGQNKTVTVTISFDNLASEYFLTSKSITTTASISLLALQVQGLNATGKVYDGTPDAFVNGVPTISGKISGDDAYLGGSPEFKFFDANTGINRIIYITGFTIEGADAQNYVLSLPNLTATVSPAPLIITPVAASKVYGETDPELTYTFVLGQLYANDKFTGTLKRELGENVGSYNIIVGNLTAGQNYNLTFVPGAKLQITPAYLTVTPDDNQGKTYGDSEPELTWTVIGQTYFGDVLTGKPNRKTGEKVGTYAIEKGTLAASNNYVLTFTTGKVFSITPRHLTIVPDTDQEKTYGQFDPSALTWKLTNGSLVSGDKIDGKLVRESGEDVGSYLIRRGTLASSLSSNYEIDFKSDVVFSISPASLTITANSGQSKIVNTADPKFTYTVNGWQWGDGNSLISGELSRKEGEEIGEYTILLGSLQVASNNYNVQFVRGIFTILPEPQITELNEIIAAPLKVYPNPVRAGVAFYITGAENRISIFNIGGTLLEQKDTNDGTAEITIGSPGLYLIRSGKETKKIEVH